MLDRNLYVSLYESGTWFWRRHYLTWQRQVGHVSIFHCLDRGFTFDDWIEDILLTPSKIASVHRPVQVLAHSIFLALFAYLWGSNQLRREPIIVAHLLCILSKLLFYCLCDPSILRIAHAVLSAVIWCLSLSFKKQNLRFVKLSSGSEQHVCRPQWVWIEGRDSWFWASSNTRPPGSWGIALVHNLQLSWRL